MLLGSPLILCPYSFHTSIPPSLIISPPPLFCPSSSHSSSQLHHPSLFPCRPQDVLATLLNNLKVQERQMRVCTTVAIAIVAETCSPFTVLPALMNEYRVPELNVQNGVLKSLSFLFEYIGEMGKDYIYAVTPLLEDALMDRWGKRGEVGWDGLVFGNAVNYPESFMFKLLAHLIMSKEIGLVEQKLVTSSSWCQPCAWASWTILNISDEWNHFVAITT